MEPEIAYINPVWNTRKDAAKSVNSIIETET